MQLDKLWLIYQIVWRRDLFKYEEGTNLIESLYIVNDCYHQYPLESKW
jgi:hypothetical protein